MLYENTLLKYTNAYTSNTSDTELRLVSDGVRKQEHKDGPNNRLMLYKASLPGLQGREHSFLEAFPPGKLCPDNSQSNPLMATIC